MPPTTLEQIRIPAALVLIALVAIVLWPRGGGEGEPSSATGMSLSPGPSGSVIVGDPGGEAVPASVPPAVTPIPTVAARQTPEPTPAPTEAPPPSTPAPAPAADGFTAEVLVCQSISGPQCNDQLGTVPASLSSFTTLVRFTGANAGDALSVALTGPSGTTPGSPYALQGGGDGYYYSTFSTAGLPGGVYTVTATRNGAQVATTEFRKAGG